jgi:predicted RNA polymerase sigma factor
LYAVLAQVQPSPVVELNRAVAIGKAQGPAFALPLVDALCDAAQLRDYGLLYAVRGDLLEQLARRDEARDAFERAASLAANARDRSLMLARAAACAEARE